MIRSLKDGVKEHLAAGRLREPGHGIEQGRLACSVRPQQTNNFSGIYAERYIVQRLNTPEAYRQIPKLEAGSYSLSNRDRDREYIGGLAITREVFGVAPLLPSRPRPSPQS